MRSILLRYLGLLLSGLKTFAVRYGVALLTYAVLWPLFRLVWRHAGIPDTGWIDTVFFAGIALAATIVWTAFALRLSLWRAVEAAVRRKQIGPVAGYAVICVIAFAGCVVADQLVDGLRPCVNHFVEIPGALFFCALTRGNNWLLFVSDPEFEAQLKPWPSYDLAHYAPLTILALVIVCARFAFRHWRRG